MKTLGLIGRCLVITTLILMMSSLADAQEDDGSVPMSVLIAIVVVVFFATIVGVVCFIQFCIKNYNPLDYFFIFCTKDTKPVEEKKTINDVRRNELIIAQRKEMNSKRMEVNSQRTEVNMQKTEVNSQAATTQKRQIHVMKMEDLYARVNKPGKRMVTVETTEVDGGIDNAGHTVSTDVFTKETVTDERRAIDNVYSESTTTQREKVFVHDSNIILREQPTRYGSETQREDMVDGEVRTERYTYSTGYTPSTSQEQLVVNMSGDNTERMKYYLEQVEGRKEVYTNESGQTVVMVREEPHVQHIETNLNIQSEENGQVNEEHREVRRVVTRRVVTDGYQQEPVQEIRRETHVIQKVENTQQEDEISSANHVENIEVSRNYIVSEAVDDTDDAQVQAAIHEIETVTSEAPVSERRETRVVTTTTTTTEALPPPPPTVTEHREVHYVRHQAEERPEIPAPDYPIEQTQIVQRRGQSMRERYVVNETGDEASREYEEMKSRVARGRETRYTYHGQPETRVVRVESQSKPKNETTVVRREYREVHEPQQTEMAVSSSGQTVVRREVVGSSAPSTASYVYEAPDSQEQRTVVTREQRIIQGGPEVVKTYVYEAPESQEQHTVVREERFVERTPEVKYVYETPESQTQRTVVRREERVIESEPQETVTTRMYETPDGHEERTVTVRREERVIHGGPEALEAYLEGTSEGQSQQTVVRREERVIHGGGPEVVKSYVYENPESQEQRTVVRREERVIESAPQQMMTTRSYEAPGSHEERTVVRREQRVIHGGPEVVETYVQGVPERQSQQTVVRREERIIHGGQQQRVSTYEAPAGIELEEGTVIVEEYIEKPGPTSTKHVYVTEDVHGQRRVITREEEVVIDDNNTVMTMEEAATGTPEAEVTYRVIKRSSEIVESPEVVETTESRDKDWYVSSATLMTPAPMDTVYIDLGPEDNVKDSSVTKTTTTTTYTVETDE